MNTRTITSLPTVLAAATAACAGISLFHFSAQAAPPNSPLLRDKAFTGAAVGKPEVAATFYGPVPVGVAVSRASRIFVSFPRTMDLGPQTLGELINGRIVAYPGPTVNALNAPQDARHLVSVQGVTIDNKNRLWALDSGKIKAKPIAPGSGAAKLVCIDLKNDRIVQTVVFPPEVAGKDAYLNDLRVSLGLGNKGTAFITDSSEQGPNGIIVVDLATGKSRRRLNDHPSVKAEKGFSATVEGQKVLVRKPKQPAQFDKTGVDGLALSGDGTRLYYCPNSGHHLYSVSTKALADAAASDQEVSATVTPLGDKGFASDGIEADADGRLFLTDYENDALRMRLPDGTYKIVVRQPTMVWPDSISVAPNNYLYYTSNQLNRRSQFHYGKDLRRKPYVLYRLRMPGSNPQASAR